MRERARSGERARRIRRRLDALQIASWNNKQNPVCVPPIRKNGPPPSPSPPPPPPPHRRSGPLDPVQQCSPVIGSRFCRARCIRGDDDFATRLAHIRWIVWSDDCPRCSILIVNYCSRRPRSFAEIFPQEMVFDASCSDFDRFVCEMRCRCSELEACSYQSTLNNHIESQSASQLSAKSATEISNSFPDFSRLLKSFRGADFRRLSLEMTRMHPKLIGRLNENTVVQNHKTECPTHISLSEKYREHLVIYFFSSFYLQVTDREERESRLLRPKNFGEIIPCYFARWDE